MKYVICRNFGNVQDWYIEFYQDASDDRPIAFGEFKSWAEAFRVYVAVRRAAIEMNREVLS